MPLWRSARARIRSALTGERLVAALGDVAGHDVHAAAMMGQIRTAARAFAQISVGSVIRRHSAG
jgi:serine phosphatase RsbU (regulator of sigma subunit)